MKKFRKILSYFILFFAFCLICMGIVHADTMFITQTYTPLQNCLNSGVCTDESDFWNNILHYNDLIQEDTNNTYYTIYFDYSSNSLWYIRSNNALNVATNFTSGTTGLYLRNSSAINYITYNLQFNSSGEITSMTSTWGEESYSGNTWFGLNAGLSLNSIILATNQSYYTYSSPTWSQNSFTITGSGTYDFNDNLPTNFLNGTTYHWSPTDIFVDPTPYCDPNNFLGQLSNVTDFTLTLKATTNALSYPIHGSFDIISNKNMSESDWSLTFTHTPDDIISTGSLSCTTNRCIFHYYVTADDDIDEDITLNYHFTSVAGVDMPTRIQINTCTNNDLNVNFSYTYNLSDTPNDNNGSVIITDDTNQNNFLQDGTLPNINGLSDTSIIPSGPVDAILTLPLNVMNALLNTLNSSTCQPLQLPIPFTGGTLILPCISTLYAQINGLNAFLTWFSAIFSAFILYQYFIYLYKWVDDTLTFRENNHFGGY